MHIQMTIYKAFFVDSAHKRWVMLDRYGNKAKITLRTTTGRQVTRTCQFYTEIQGEEYIQITYKGERMLITRETVLKD